MFQGHSTVLSVHPRSNCKKSVFLNINATFRHFIRILLGIQYGLQPWLIWRIDGIFTLCDLRCQYHHRPNYITIFTSDITQNSAFNYLSRPYSAARYVLINTCYGHGPFGKLKWVLNYDNFAGWLLNTLSRMLYPCDTTAFPAGKLLITSKGPVDY